MRNSGWQALGGADTEGVMRYGMIGFDGATVHGWVQAQRPGEDPVIGYASADLDELEQELKTAMTAAGSHEAAAGLFGIGKMLKKLARKTGITKVLKTATKLANYALSNPLVKGALAATGPMGMSVLAAHQGYRMLKKYAKGNPKAMRFVKGVVKAARGGNVKAIKMQRMLRLGQRAFGPGALRRYAVRRAGTPPRYGTRRWGPRYQPLCPRGRVSGDLEAIAGADVVELGKWIAGGGAGVAYMGEDIEKIDLGGMVSKARRRYRRRLFKSRLATDPSFRAKWEQRVAARRKRLDLGYGGRPRRYGKLLPSEMGRRAGHVGDWEITGDIGDWEIGGTDMGADEMTFAIGDWEISGPGDGEAGHPPGEIAIGDDELIDFVIGEMEGAPGAPGEILIGLDEDAETDQDIRDLNEFAASAGAWEGIALLGEDLGAFEGLAWAADRLGVHSMAERPREMSARDALLDGRQGQAARFPM